MSHGVTPEGGGLKVFKKHPLELKNRWQSLEEYTGDSESVIGSVAGKRLTRESGIVFNVTNAKRPLASAVKMCEAGNRIFMDATGCYIQNIKTGEKMALRKEGGTFVFDVQYSVNDEVDAITLDSGAGVSVWPVEKLKQVEMLPRKLGLRMIAANGTEMSNYGQKFVKFRGIAGDTDGGEELDFRRRA